MDKLQYLHPYFMEAFWYFARDMRKAEFVYIKEIDGNVCDIVLYNEDKTNIIYDSGWYHQDQLVDGYDDNEWRKIQTELDELWADWDKDETE